MTKRCEGKADDLLRSLQNNARSTGICTLRTHVLAGPPSIFDQRSLVLVIVCVFDHNVGNFSIDRYNTQDADSKKSRPRDSPHMLRLRT